MTTITFITVNFGNILYEHGKQHRKFILNRNANYLNQWLKSNEKVVVAVQECTSNFCDYVNDLYNIEMVGSGRLEGHPILNALTLGKGNESCTIFTNQHIEKSRTDVLFDGKRGRFLWPRVATSATISGEGYSPVPVTTFHCAPSSQKKIQLEQYKELLKIVKQNPKGIYLGQNNSKIYEENNMTFALAMKKLNYIDIPVFGKTYRADKEEFAVSSIWIPEEMEQNIVEDAKIIDLPECKHNAVKVKIAF